MTHVKQGGPSRGSAWLDATRLERVEELWGSIADEHEALALTDEQREDLERRLAEADADPSGGSPWEDVRERIRHRPR